MYSVVLILSVDQVGAGNAVSAAMGWGSPAYTVPLSATGMEPVTHYGLHTWAAQEFVDLLDGAEAGIIPSLQGIASADIAQVVGSLVSSVRTSADGHWDGVLSDNGLITIAYSAV